VYIYIRTYAPPTLAGDVACARAGGNGIRASAGRNGRAAVMAEGVFGEG